MADLSRTQIDRLGDRLRRGPIIESDLRSLDDYRLSFGEAYEHVFQTIREKLNLEPTGRPAKSTTSIIEKLKRESIRLSQIQDIAGCRLVVTDVLNQDTILASLRMLFPGASVVDRRVAPSYGYRAVHVIPRVFEKLFEIQVRSSLQHLWAELSEKLSDVIDPSIKYGGGEKTFRQILQQASELVAKQEDLDQKVLAQWKKGANQSQVQDLEEDAARIRAEIASLLNETIARVKTHRGESQ